MRRNGWQIAEGRVDIVRVPLKVPFITALGKKSETINVGVELRLRNGASGYGEASGSVVAAHVKPETIARILGLEIGRAIGQDARRLKPFVSDLRKRRSAYPTAAAAIECALSSALAQSFGLRLCDWFGGTQESIDTDITLSAGSIDATTHAAKRAASEGFRAFKIKVGTGPSADQARVAAAWDIIQHTPSATVILDGNQGLSPRQALSFAQACLKSQIPVVLFEQPVGRDDIKGMAWLRKRSPVPIAADESVRSAADAYRILSEDAADVLNIKVAKSGLQESLEIIGLARAARKKLMIGCMQETARGLSPSVHLACGTGAFQFVDLDSDHLLVPNQPTGDFMRAGRTIILNFGPCAASRTESRRSN